MRNFYKFIASGFGAGLLPLAPGTWGALLGVIIIFFLESFYQADFNYLLVGLILSFCWIGASASDYLTEEWGQDPKQIVIDELVGMWISVLFLPHELKFIIAGFILFRFFDIAKPLGIRRMESFKNGWGVMLDDVLAGIYSNMTLQLFYYIFIYERS